MTFLLGVSDIQSLFQADLLIVVSMNGKFLLNKRDLLDQITNKILITKLSDEQGYMHTIHLGNSISNAYDKYDLIHIFDRMIDDYKQSSNFEL